MAQELGRIERPSAEQYQGKRKLLLVPLLHELPAEAKEGQAILEKYWDQVRSQTESLELALGGLSRIYHESLTESGEEGLKHLEAADQAGFNFAQAKFQAGASLEATEDAELLAETFDLQRCLMMPLTSEKVARRLHEWLCESSRNRYEYVSQQIDGTLKENELGLLMINERHQVQFPSDIEVFYVAPPALSEFHRWVESWVAQQQEKVGQGETGEQVTREESQEAEEGKQ